MATNFTPNLHLPQWAAGDKPNFLSEINGAWSAIDLGYGQNKTDAATAITTANGASSNAQDAVIKVNALSAQLVTMQQSIAQLEADFINKAYIVADSPTVTAVNSFTVKSASAYHNGYVGRMSITITMPIGTYTPTNSIIKLASISGLPYTYTAFTTLSRLAVENISNIHAQNQEGAWVLAKVNLAQDSINLVTPASIVVTAPFDMECIFTFMITTNSNNRRSIDIPENCAVL